MRWSIGSVAQLPLLAVLALLVVVVSGQEEGIVIRADGSKHPPGYAVWARDKFSASYSMRGGVTFGTNGYWRVIRGAYCPIPIREEGIAIGVTTDGVNAKVFSEGQWNTHMHSSQSFRSGFNVDVRYESQSGNPVIVWHHEDETRIVSDKRTGSSWSVSTFATPVFDGKHDELNLEASPKTNEMVLMVGNEGSNDYAMVWDGGKWGNGVDLKNWNNNSNITAVNVAFEHQRGRAIIVYENGTPFLKYRIWNGVAWSGERSVSPPAGIQGRIGRIAIGADPSTDRIVAAVTTTDNEFWVTVWDGNNDWGSKAIVASGRQQSGAPYDKIAVAYEGISQQALATYTKENNEVKYRTWSLSSGWSEEERGPNLGGLPNSMMLCADNGRNAIMLSVYDSDRDSFFCKWSGAGWGEVTKMIPDTDTDTDTDTESSMDSPQPLFFMWKPKAKDTKAPNDDSTLRPTPPATPFPTPTSAPSTPPPTDLPTPLPTRTPTPQPSPSPTPVLTQSPKPVPLLKPTIVPTPDPTRITFTNSGQSPSPTENENIEALEDTKRTGHPCSNNRECQSRTCRDGVCMATSACYPLKHKFGEPFFKHKVNIVFVASGFHTSTNEEWQAHVNRIYRSFENYNMFSNEIEQLNVFRVEPGMLDSAFCAPGCVGIPRLLCCDQNRALSLAQKCFPIGSNFQTVVVHNDERYAGGGYVNDNIATVSTHPLASGIAAHELGHSLFDLTDEYSYGPGTDKDPNCASTSRCDKWSDLIGNTPAGYDPVRCLPGCRNGNYFVGTVSFMNILSRPMGAVNDRFTCCTYLALTKSFPPYCDVFDPSPNYLLNYCRNNDYQRYGTASYDRDPLLSISDGSVQNSSTKYVLVGNPVLVLIKAKIKHSGVVVYRCKQSRLDAGMFLRSSVEGDFSSSRMALKQGFDGLLLKVTVFYRSGKEHLFYSRNTTIEVPISQHPAADDEEPLVVVSKQAGSVRIILDTQEREVTKIRVKEIDLSYTPVH